MKFKFLINRFMELGFLLFCLIVSSCSKSDYFFNKTSNKHTQEKHIPQRIISLSPSATEILFAIGAQNQIAARSDFCDFPENAKNIPSVGGFDGKTLSIEKILSFSPDFVYLTNGMHNYLIPFLQKHNIAYYISVADSVQTVLQEIAEIGKITDHQLQAQKLCNQIKQDLQKIAEQNKSKPKVTVYWEVWTPPYMSAGKNSFINEIITYAGGINIFSDIEQPYPVVSEEAILMRNPQIIIIPNSTVGGTTAVTSRKNWQNISAVKNNKIYSVDTNIISRPGPRISQAIELISNCIYN
jgi:iron complex transport system substrate-binding protein